jgi:AcrR family transcriptional regulator
MKRDKSSAGGDATGSRRWQNNLQTRTSIIEAAENLLGTEDIHRFSMERVATAARLSRRTVYNVFVDREQLLEVACDRMLDKVAAKLPVGVRPTSRCRTAITNYATALIPVLASRPNRALLAVITRDSSCRSWLSGKYESRVRLPIWLEFQQLLAGLEAAGACQCGDKNATAVTFFSLLEALIDTPAVLSGGAARPPFEDADVITLVVDLVLTRHIQPPPRQGRSAARKAA